MSPLRTCEFPGCQNRHAARGLCSSHYHQRSAGKALKPLYAARTERESRSARGRKVCAKCKVELPLSDFGTSSRSRDGLRWRCLPCEKPTPEQRQRRLEAQRQKYWDNRTPKLIGIRAAQYQISYDVAEWLIAQPCFICCKTTEHMHIDHCHDTGAVRGSLCLNCNTALGKLRDDPALLRRAADYLEAGRDFRTEVNCGGNPQVLPGLGTSS